MIALLQALQAAAWERYTDASCRASKLAGTQFNLWDAAMDERREWLGIVIALGDEMNRVAM